MVFLYLLVHGNTIFGQTFVELKNGWACRNVLEVPGGGEEISRLDFPIGDWMPATVPGTILTTLLNNGLVPDPYYGLNNELIPDIYDTGSSYYTYWFVNDFNLENTEPDDEIWLHFRGVNYSVNIYLNGSRINENIHSGMFLRQTYNITPLVNKNANNRLAVIVFPPDPPGNPNGGQGGDGVIARNVTHQYVAGWDWIQPVRDRNTGIWDQVGIERTGPVNIKNSHIVTIVPGTRNPGNHSQEPVTIRVSAELENPTSQIITGTLRYRFDGNMLEMNVEVPGHTTKLFHFPDLELKDPQLWWPNGYGSQHLYTMRMSFLSKGTNLSDEEITYFGIRDISTSWNPLTRSRQVMVNGQKIFIKGGNWIISDAMLRFSRERYDAEVRFHRDMNLNLIRIWGGAIMERPEFYEACDRHGIMVMQDFSMSGDCNGRWNDRRKKEDQWTRRQYPDDHDLFIRSIADQVKMLRNHPSLAIYCGGNEIAPPADILTELHTLLDSLDGTRWFVESSTSDDMSYNFIGGNGDGPYSIQPHDVFWEKRSFPFNSEVGSVGLSDYESLERFIPDSSMIIPGQYIPRTGETPGRWGSVEPNWRYHKYLGYGHFIEKYGNPATVREYTQIAQLINYDQYRALVEGFTSHMWEWYTGFIIWKTQNPWTAMRGQMYDWYLDPNAGLYGLHHGSEPVHIMFNPVESMIMIANHTFKPFKNLMALVQSYDASGNSIHHYQQLVDLEPSMIKMCQGIDRAIKTARAKDGLFLSMKLLNESQELLSENLYWLPDSTGNYPILKALPQSDIKASAHTGEDGWIDVTLGNEAGNPLAFFIRVSLVDRTSGKRILPTFYSDNYVSLEPGHQKTIRIECHGDSLLRNTRVHLEGWNVQSMYLEIEDELLDIKKPSDRSHPGCVPTSGLSIQYLDLLHDFKAPRQRFLIERDQMVIPGRQ